MTAIMLRATPLRACGMQPLLLRSTTSSPSPAYPIFGLGSQQKPCAQKSTSPTRSLTTSTKSKRTTLLFHKHPQLAQRTSRRSASTSAAEQDAAAAAAAASSEAAHSTAPPLDWNTFFTLRKQRRRLQLIFSALGCVGGGTLGALYLSTGQAEWFANMVPLDPFVTMGLMTFGCAALGWLAGPSAGSAVFYLFRSRYKPQMRVKESQFFARIKKHRVDPSSSSAGNPVPDFYGEKIQSVAGYRQWLKDQRAYNKKRMTFV